MHAWCPIDTLCDLTGKRAKDATNKLIQRTIKLANQFTGRGLGDVALIFHSNHYQVATQVHATPGLQGFIGAGGMNIRAMLPAWKLLMCQMEHNRRMLSQHTPPFSHLNKSDKGGVVTSLFKATFGATTYTMSVNQESQAAKFKLLNPGWWPENVPWTRFSHMMDQNLQSLFTVLCTRASDKMFDNMLEALHVTMSLDRVPLVAAMMRNERISCAGELPAAVVNTTIAAATNADATTAAAATNAAATIAATAAATPVGATAATTTTAAINPAATAAAAVAATASTTRGLNIPVQPAFSAQAGPVRAPAAQEAVRGSSRAAIANRGDGDENRPPTGTTPARSGPSSEMLSTAMQAQRHAREGAHLFC